MNPMLATDVNNPDFVGATSPNDGIYCKFEMHTPEDANKSAALGRKVYATRMEERIVEEDGKKVKRYVDTGEPLKIPYVTIMKPGDSTSIIHTAVREDHKRRWPNEWLYFQMQEGLVEDGAQIPGWKIDEWPEISDAESLRNLKHARFYTVEQIAGASDAQIQRLGMGAAGLREKAKRALREKLGLDISTEIRAKDAEIAALKKADEEKEKRLKALEALVLNAAPVAPQPPQDNAHVAPGATPFPERKKRKYTRRTKPEATA